MQIIAGKIRGKKLLTLEGTNTRPTPTRIKENIFNILQNYINFEQKVIADFFGGSGSLTLESLSRNAKFAFINDNNHEAVRVIKQNVVNCHMQDRVLISTLDYKLFSNTIKTNLDLVFIDPPFAILTCQQWILDFLFNNKLLNQNALIVFETNTELKKLSLNKNFSIISERKYSKIYIKIIKYQKVTE